MTDYLIKPSTTEGPIGIDGTANTAWASGALRALQQHLRNANLNGRVLEFRQKMAGSLGGGVCAPVAMAA